MRCHGRRMAPASPQGVMIIQCRYGMPPMEGMSIMEEAIQSRRYGMPSMGGMSTSIVGIPSPYGHWHGRRMAPASPQEVRIKQCRCGKLRDSEHWHIDFRYYSWFIAEPGLLHPSLEHLNTLGSHPYLHPSAQT